MNMKRRILSPPAVLCAAAALLLLVVAFSISTGSVAFPLSEVFTALRESVSSKARDIIFSIRLPRVLLGAMVGMNMAVSGSYMQAVMRNPMADPGIIGVSSGAALAAVSIMLLFPHLSYLTPIVAFAGGCMATMIVFALSWKNGADPVRIILSGVAVNALLGGGVSLLSLLYNDRIQGVLLWMNGSLSGKSFADLYPLVFFSILGLIASFACIPFANALILGDDAAKNLGIHVTAARICLCVVSAYLTGVSVATVGLIGFIGLIVPHIARMLVGSEYKRLIPLSAILGATLLVGADCAARTVFTPIEIPVGVVMSVLGSPFFIWLLKRKGRVL